MHGGQMAVAVERSEVRDPQRPHQRPRAAEQFPKDRPDGCLRQRPFVLLRRVGERIVILGGDEGGLAGRVLQLSDLSRNRRPTIDRLEDLAVESLQFAPEPCRLRRHLERSSCPTRFVRGTFFVAIGMESGLRVLAIEETGLLSTCIGVWRACQRPGRTANMADPPVWGLWSCQNGSLLREFASAASRSVVAMDNVSY